MKEDKNTDKGPGTFSCHEALHMTSVIENIIDQELCHHQSIMSNPKWHNLSIEALNTLRKLYDEIAKEHFT